MPELTRRYIVMTMATEAPFDMQDPEAPFVLKPWKDPAALRALSWWCPGGSRPTVTASVASGRGGGGGSVESSWPVTGSNIGCPPGGASSSGGAGVGSVGPPWCSRAPQSMQNRCSGPTSAPQTSHCMSRA